MSKRTIKGLFVVHLFTSYDNKKSVQMNLKNAVSSTRSRGITTANKLYFWRTLQIIN
jgi:hypothetical protein